MAYRSGVFPYKINVLNYTHASERDYLADLLREQGVDPVFSLLALQRRQFWATTLPTGAFLNEFRVSHVDYMQNIHARDALVAEARRNLGLGVRAGRTVIEHEGNLYYHQHVIDVLRRVAPEPAFLQALHNFFVAVKTQPALIKGPRVRRPYVPLERRARVAGHLARGPAWRPEEDLVLRQWFAQRAYGPDAGKHVKLTEEQWAIVLKNLEGRRTKGSVLARIVVLNHQLKRELSVDGFIPRNRYREYFSRVLGENPRSPRTSPLRRRRA